MTRVVAVFFLAFAVCAQAAELPQTVIDPEQSFVSASIPALSEYFTELEYKEGEPPRIFLYDLDGDKSEDVLIRSNESLCRSGGCVYLLLDGKSRNRIGYFFGDTILIMKKKKGDSFPDMQACLVSESGRGIVQNYSYFRGMYVSRSQVDVPAEQLQRTINELPVAKSHGKAVIQRGER